MGFRKIARPMETLPRGGTIFRPRLRPKEDHLEWAVHSNHRYVVVNKLKEILRICNNYSAPMRYVSQRIKDVGFTYDLQKWLKKYPTLFEVYYEDSQHWCMAGKKLRLYIEEEREVNEELLPSQTEKLIKLLMLARGYTLNCDNFSKVVGFFGIPEGYMLSIVGRNPELFRVFDHIGQRSGMEIQLTRWMPDLAVSAVQKKHGPSHDLNDDGIRYVSPYVEGLCSLEDLEDLDENEKANWIVGVLHELLSLTLRKTIPISNLSRFCREFRLPDDLVQFLLKYPRVFYMTRRPGVLTLILKEAYDGKVLREKEPLAVFQDRLLDMMQEGLHEHSWMGTLRNREKEKAKEERKMMSHISYDQMDKFRVKGVD